MHACKFYTGRSHLISSLLLQAEQALNKNLMLIYCTDEDFSDNIFPYYKKIIKLSQNSGSTIEDNSHYEIYQKSIIREAIGNSVFINHYDNLNSITSYIDKQSKKSRENGLSGINICIQADQIYLMLGGEKLKILENNITSAAVDNSVMITCLYDVYKSYKNNMVSDIISIHEYAAYCSNYYKVEEIYK